MLETNKHKLVPVDQQRHVPKMDENIIVDLPSERVRAVVMERVSDDVFVVQLYGTIIGKAHSYRPDDVVAVQRHKNVFEQYVWEVIDQTRINQMEQAQQLAQQAAGIAEPVEPEPDEQETEDATPARKQPRSRKQ